MIMRKKSIYITNALNWRCQLPDTSL